MSLRSLLAALSFLTLAWAAPGQAVAPKVAAGAEGEPQPLLVVQGSGPTAPTTSLAFSPDGQTLYAAGYDKVVRTWQWDGTRFVLQDRAYRIPIGPGTSGVINRLAVSPDGDWLAVTGLGVVRGEAGFREEGIVLPVSDTWDAERWSDRGLIHLFNLRDARAGKAPEVRLLRGHRGVVTALAFAPAGRDGVSPRSRLGLVSAAAEPQEGGKYRGRVLVWDVNRPNPVAQYIVPEVNPLKPPGLAVRRTGPGRTDLRVALAWRDGKLRVWDVGAARQLAPIRDGDVGDLHWDLTAAFLPGPRLLTGGFNRAGYLRTWSWEDGAGTQPVAGDPVPFRADGFAYLLPTALDVVPARDGGDGHVAVVFRVRQENTKREFFDLYLVSPDGLRPEATAFLGDVAEGDPILACSPDGRFVAVAGPGARPIRVYQTDDLLHDRGRPQQLAGVGTVFRRLAFARKRNAPELGLFLGDPARESGLLFDFANHRLTRDAAEKGLWSVAGPEGWSVRASGRPEAPGERELEWSHAGDGQSVTIHLEAGEEVTAYAVAPPLPGVTAHPTLAVATWQGARGEPVLMLYEGQTGEPVRQLKGHAGRITSLAASPDGRFLASAATDETVCLWSLTDLDQVIGKHGRLTGAVLKPQGRDLLVESVEKGGAAADVLKPGDVITGLSLRENDPKPRTGLSVLDFYLALWDVPPAGTVWLRVRGQAKPVPLRLEQGVDDRKPALSLFVAPRGAGEPRWIAWTPLGPFDSSGRDAERYVGVHLNPDRLGEPVRFADIDQYREKLYRPQLLPLLLQTADVHKAIQESRAPAPKPKIQLVSVAGVTRPDRQGEFLVRDRRLPVRFTVEGPSLADEEVKAVVVTVDGKPGPRVDLDEALGQELAATVEVPRRGTYTVHIEVRTADDSGSLDVPVRYQPAAPRIDWTDPAQDGARVDQENYTLRATITPAADESAEVFVNGEPVTVGAGGRVTKVLKLAPGKNRVAVKAVNVGALPGHEDAETTLAERIIDYREPQAADARFTEVEPRSGTREGDRIKVGAGAVTVDGGRLGLRGAVTAPEGERLALVRLLRKVGGKEKVVEEFKDFPDEGKVFQLDQEVSLEPGPQEFLLVAKTARNKESRSAGLRVEFLPPLPELRVASPQQDTEVVQGKDRAPGQAAVAAAWRLPEEFYPFEAVVRVLHDGKPVPQGTDNREDVVVRFDSREAAARFDEAAAARAGARILAAVRLTPGNNRVEVQAQSRWRTGQVVARAVTFRRPPFVFRLDAESPVTEPFTRVTAVAESPSDLPLTAVRVNGQSYKPDAVARKQDDPARGITSYTVAVDRVPLENLGDNEVRLEVQSADGSDRATRTVVVKQAPPKASVEARDLIVRQLPFDLPFRVKSLSPLARVELKRGDRTLRRLAVARPNLEGTFAAERFPLPLGPEDLEEGDNSLVLEAENAGGVQPRPFTVTYLPPPLRLEVDQPQPPAQGAAVTVHGWLVWKGQPPKDLEKKARQLAVSVNDFLQGAPPRLGRRLPDRLEFTADAVLNAPENLIRVECPALPLEADGIPKLRPVACAAPEKPSTLRLLIVNATEPIPEKTLLLHALRALHLSQQDNQLHNQVFRQIISYHASSGPSSERFGVLSGFVTRDRVLEQLEQIENDITAEHAANDVVLIYWVGKDAVESRGDWYLTTADDPDNEKGKPERTAVPLKRLLGMGRSVPGGRVVLLDLAAGDKAGGDHFDWRGSRAAVIRYAWSRESVPVPGLLTVLEGAARGRPRVSLQDLVRAAAELLPLPLARSVRLSTNLEGLPYLSGLVLSGQ